MQDGIGGLDAFNRTDLVQVLFSTPVSELSFLTDGYSDETTFEAYNSSGMLLETQNALGDPTTISFASIGISRLDMLQGDDEFTYAIDNLSYNAGAVPEPSSLAVFGLIMLATGIRSGRRRTNR